MENQFKQMNIVTRILHQATCSLLTPLLYCDLSCVNSRQELDILVPTFPQIPQIHFSNLPNLEISHSHPSMEAKCLDSGGSGVIRGGSGVGWDRPRLHSSLTYSFASIFLCLRASLPAPFQCVCPIPLQLSTL